jgi:hypothetical protein
MFKGTVSKTIRCVGNMSSNLPKRCVGIMSSNVTKSVTYTNSIGNHEHCLLLEVLREINNIYTELYSLTCKPKVVSIVD